MEDLADAVRAYLASHELSQAELASRAQISQSSVSRVLSGHPIRHGRARASLSAFIHYMAPGASPDPIAAAVEQTWDGSAQHAEALARLILASRDLWPRLTKE